MELELFYEVAFGTYESKSGKKAELLVVIEFEEDEELGLMATFYTTAKDIDREFFSYSLCKSQKKSELSDKDWMKYCKEIAKEDVASGEITFSDVKNWLDRH